MNNPQQQPPEEWEFWAEAWVWVHSVLTILGAVATVLMLCWVWAYYL